MRSTPKAGSTHDAFARMEAQFSATQLLRKRIQRQAAVANWHLGRLLVRGSQRFAVILSATLVLTLASPLLFLLALIQMIRGVRVLTFEPRIGRWCVTFRRVEFNTEGAWGTVLRRTRLYLLPTLLHIVRGEMSWIGPRATAPGEMNARQRAVRKRSNVRPGMLSLWWLRKKANIHFGKEVDVDLEYIDRQTMKGDLGIALRSVPSLLYGSSVSTTPEQVEILGVKIDNLTMEEALDYIVNSAGGEKPRQLCFVNTDCLNKVVSDQPYRELLHQSDLVLADGIGLRLAGKLIGSEIRQNVNGTDLFPLLCEHLSNSPLGFFFLGARKEVVNSFADWTKQNYPGVQVKGQRDGYFDDAQEGEVREQIRNSGAQILLVAFGSPRQDMWIRTNLASLGAVRVAMGVGGLFDFYSGRIPRAPQWMRELSLEWVYRLYQEPGRMWRRYLLGNVIFLWRVAWSRLRKPSRSGSTPIAR